jgi:hypothetical protein
MEKKDIPQDPSLLDNFTTEICYAVDKNGRYTTKQSRGWEVKSTALDITWQDIENKVKQTKQRVLKGEISQLQFFMELRIMDVGMVAAYTGFWKWKIKRHLKSKTFNKLSEKTLQKYAEIFDVSLAVLKSMDIHET